MRWFLPLAALFILILPEAVMAQQATIPLVTTTPNANGGSDYALGIQILLVMTVLTLLPAMLITMTSFTRVLIVLAILRQAMGTAQTPSNQIILGLSLFLSLAERQQAVSLRSHHPPANLILNLLLDHFHPLIRLLVQGQE